MPVDKNWLLTAAGTALLTACAAPRFTAPPPDAPPAFELSTPGGQWPAQEWGKNRATAESARLLAGASRAEQNAVKLTTLAGVANGYFQLLALRERLAVAQSNRDVAKQLQPYQSGRRVRWTPVEEVFTVSVRQVPKRQPSRLEQGFRGGERRSWTNDAHATFRRFSGLATRFGAHSVAQLPLTLQHLSVR